MESLLFKFKKQPKRWNLKKLNKVKLAFEEIQDTLHALGSQH